MIPWARVEVWEGLPWSPDPKILLNSSNEDSTYAINLAHGKTYGVQAWGDGDPGFLGLREVLLTEDTAIRFVGPSRPPAPPTVSATLSLHVRYSDGTVVARGRVAVWDGVPDSKGSTRLLDVSNMDSTYSVVLQTPRRYYIQAWGDPATGYLGQRSLDLTTDMTVTFVDPTNPYPLSRRLELMYYGWYGNLTTDGHWIHWDEAGHHPPDDTASAFYPTLGPYSSADLAIAKQHMQWIRESGAGVLVYSWWGPNTIPDQRLPAVLDQAARFGLKVAIHMEPGAYHTSPAAVIQAAADLEARFSSHAAFLDRLHIFLATQFSLDRWKAALSANHRGLLLAQITDPQWMDIFDGLYQYDGSIHLSTASWAILAAKARTLGKIFIPNVAPGYDESRAAGGRAFLTVDREKGARYDRLWSAALGAGVDYIAITSFNEWHEGTQIEPVRPKAGYHDYGGSSATNYIESTLYWVREFLTRQAYLATP